MRERCDSNRAGAEGLAPLETRLMAGLNGGGAAVAASVHRWCSTSPAAGYRPRSTHGAAERPAAVTAPSQTSDAAAAAVATGGGGSTTGTVLQSSGCRAIRTPLTQSCCPLAGTGVAILAPRLPGRCLTPDSGGSRWNAGGALVASGADGSGRSVRVRCCYFHCLGTTTLLKGAKFTVIKCITSAHNIYLRLMIRIIILNLYIYWVMI